MSKKKLIEGIKKDSQTKWNFEIIDNQCCLISNGIDYGHDEKFIDWLYGKFNSGEKLFTNKNSSYYFILEDDEDDYHYFKIRIYVNEDNIKEVLSDFPIINQIENISGALKLSKIIDKLPLEFL